MTEHTGIILKQKVRRDKVLFSRKLRKRPTEAEKHLWSHLRHKQMLGLRFRRQQIIAGFIADFYCEAARLVIEVDGSGHDDADQIEYDRHRKRVFEKRGLREIRYPNERVLNDTDRVLENIEEQVKSYSPFPPCEGRDARVGSPEESQKTK